MKSIKLIFTAAILVAFASCRDTKKEEQMLDSQIDSIQAVELQLDETVKEVEQKREEVEDLLTELDSI
ncbi:hypothetical protein [Cellulophaga baltica]|uniref:hypothetical protein n=1 Tax=Cellulophaga baltica TaxID=76594 RepID=UPI000421EFC8|nr:hypothetical protein [Cellulophaga baltica]AIY11937.1 hypothetical protein M667_01145 [Cellulophaga baltica NN016038]MBA6314263.1 hypothetical protein [Cellulophaga baltica]